MQRPNQRERLKLVLARERKQRELTQEEVAEAIGASLRNYQRWEQGEVYPQAYYLQRLREYFGPCIDEIPAPPSIDPEKPSKTASPSLRWPFIYWKVGRYPRFIMIVVAFLVITACFGLVLHLKHPYGIGHS